ncbi:MAG TPA: helix-turn-helix transcriptional regulator [Pseudobacter sp.]|nr:helix-turn-helix transcriptional regulator [Pseudobacter sp.]
MKQIILNELLSRIGKNLLTIRTAKRQKLETVAKELGFKDHTSISKIENAKNEALTVAQIVNMCNYYGTTLEEVLDLENTNIYNMSQVNETGTTNNSLKQVINDLSEGYKLAFEQSRFSIEQKDKEILYLRTQVEELRRKLDKPGPGTKLKK